jgi:hypothetical protein
MQKIEIYSSSSESWHLSTKLHGVTSRKVTDRSLMNNWLYWDFIWNLITITVLIIIIISSSSSSSSGCRKLSWLLRWRNFLPKRTWNFPSLCTKLISGSYPKPVWSISQFPPVLFWILFHHSRTGLSNNGRTAFEISLPKFSAFLISITRSLCPSHQFILLNLVILKILFEYF